MGLETDVGLTDYAAMLASVCPPPLYSLLRHRAFGALVALLGAHALAPGSAHAGGFEYGVPGARSLGRGGADVAGIDNGLALYYNPANLARISNARVTLDTNLGIYDICMRRELVGDPADYAPAEEAALVENVDGRNFLPNVCNDGRPSIVPNIGAAIPLMDGLTLGIGLLVPVSSQIQSYGRPDGSLDDMGTGPTPTRYIITQQDLLQVFGTVGIGYQPIPELRFGAAFGWGYTHAKFTNVARDDELTIDAASYLDASDKFVPRVTVSAATTPVPGLDIAASYTYVGDVNASGTVDLDVFGERVSGPTASLNAGQPWNFQLAIRFADRLETPVGHANDRLATERWDIEMDLGIIGSSVVQRFAVDLPDDAMVAIIELPDQLNIEKRWKNQYSVRLGGDYNIIPGQLSARMGLSYESSGVRHGFEQIDFLPVQRVGIHLGGTVRIADHFDISLAYAHIFQDTTDVRGASCTSTTCLNRPVAQNNPPPEQLVTANAGIIKSKVNLLSLQLEYIF